MSSRDAHPKSGDFALQPTQARPSRSSLLPSTIGFVAVTITLFALSLSPFANLWILPTKFDINEAALHCATIPPISSAEFHQRQNNLARLLYAHNASAYIAEPGGSATYFGNLSITSWKLSERPLAIIITPDMQDGDVIAKVHILTPRFEATRAKLLSVPSIQPIEYIEWAEDASPYTHAAERLFSGSKVFVDGSIRHFLVDGFQKAAGDGIDVVTAPREISLVREKKSTAELEILKCVNEATLLAMRTVIKQLHVGIQESEASVMMSNAFTEAGLRNGGCLTLFGENAALPHGSGTNRRLGRTDFALFDCGANLHGYQSDITRTVALPHTRELIPKEHLKIWHYVHEGQELSRRLASNHSRAASIDKGVRRLLKSYGYEKYFTHRLGHGIGLEGHEAPYLNGGNTDDVIDIGHTFSLEPGIYIEGDVGVRLEDCAYIHENGTAILLTEGVGGSARSPWDP